uniref:Ankyrin repeat domain 10b n=1 Tax=Nothobranchius korthausae TaxID=1143690 RepID=A0A1A8GYV3_9TELE
MRNAGGLTAADLAHAQGFQECAQILANALNLQQNVAQSHNGAFLNGMSQNGGHALPIIQGRSFLNGVPNRKRSFEGIEANPLKKARPNALFMAPGFLNGNGPLGGTEESQMESVNMEMMASVTSGGPGSFALGQNGFAPPLGPLDQDQGPQDKSSAATKELEVITVASMQTPCRCTNSYAYL